MQNQVIWCSKSKDELYHELYLHAHSGAYVSYLRGARCVTEEDFFYEVSASFQFPWYFGENWAAFDECICDLEWLEFSSILIVVDDFNSLFAGNKKSQQLLENHFRRMVAYWGDMSIPVEVWLNVIT